MPRGCVLDNSGLKQEICVRGAGHHTICTFQPLCLAALGEPALSHAGSTAVQEAALTTDVLKYFVKRFAQIKIFSQLMNAAAEMEDNC